MITCIFAKEYRDMAGYKPGATFPALEIAKYVVFLYCRLFSFEPNSNYMCHIISV